MLFQKAFGIIIHRNVQKSVFSETHMMYFTLPVHVHVLEFIKETGFCSCFQFYTDAKKDKDIQRIS